MTGWLLVPPLLAAVLAGALLAWLLRAALQEFGRNRVPCLLYHHILPRDAAGDSGRVDPVYVCWADRFAEQMAFLKRAGYATLTLDDLLRARDEPHRMPPRPVLVTFDDGFSSVYRLAYPVLKQNGQIATVFMTPDRRSENFRAFAGLDRPLNPEEVGELAAGGFDIQSHGLTHRFLTDLDDADLARDLTESRRLVANETGRTVRYLAIPGGAYDRRVRRFARDAGYRAVFCMRKGSVGPGTDLFCLPRMVVSRGMTLEDFRCLLTPTGWLRGRIISLFQEAISRTLGMRRTDLVRDRLYHSLLAPLLRPQVLVWVLLSSATAMLLAILAMLLLR